MVKCYVLRIILGKVINYGENISWLTPVHLTPKA